MINEFLRTPAPARRINLTAAVLIATAWGLLILWQRSHYADLLGHESLGDHHFSFSVKLMAFLLSWFLMTVAMMLPGSMPALIHSAQPTRGYRFLVWIIVGYLSPWVLFGLLAFLGDSVLHEFAEAGGPLAGFSRWIAPAIVLTAGLYQFTSIKRRFTLLCQTSQPMHSRVEMKNLTNALGEGIRFGFFCVGSCWSLMLLMFALGHHQLVWMFIMGVIFAVERLTPWGQKLSWLVGFVLLVWVLFWLLSGVIPG